MIRHYFHYFSDIRLRRLLSSRLFSFIFRLPLFLLFAISPPLFLLHAHAIT